MTKFYTGRGDGGMSSVGAGKIPKNDKIFELLGGLDELNSWLGFCQVAVDSAASQFKEVSAAIARVQQDIFIAQAETAAMSGGYRSNIKIKKSQIKNLEKIIDRAGLIIPPITKFIIPGGSELSARLDIGRTMARRIERAAQACTGKNQVNPELMRYLNRLSSLLFALARLVNVKLKIKEKNPNYK